MANKIYFGIKNVHYAIKTSGTWGTPVALPGAVKVALTPSGSSASFYADDSEYVKFEVGSGYEGDLELAYVPDGFFTSLLGFETDTKGGVLELNKTVAKPFALLFEIEGDEKNRRFIFYNVTATRPPINANTTSESTSPDTQTLTISCQSMELSSGTSPNTITKNVVKLAMERSSDNSTNYDAWFTTVYTPTFVAQV